MQEDRNRGYSYPPYVESDDERHRFDLSVLRAVELFEEGPASETVWMAAREIYKSDIPTDQPEQTFETPA